jgi:lysozyme
MEARVVDLSHFNDVRDFGMVAEAGVWGIIHKATEGIDYEDPDYAGRRVLAERAGLLWGAYHFNTGDNVDAQVRWFVDKARPDDRTLMVLDYEDNRLSQMSIEQAVDFLRQLEVLTGRKGAIYSGDRIKETIGELGPDDRAYLISHRLWLSQYDPYAELPAGFSNWWLWQFTGDGVGPHPHIIPGIAEYGIDINTFRGTRADLAASWA